MFWQRYAYDKFYTTFALDKHLFIILPSRDVTFLTCVYSTVNDRVKFRVQSLLCRPTVICHAENHSVVYRPEKYWWLHQTRSHAPVSLYSSFTLTCITLAICLTTWQMDLSTFEELFSLVEWMIGFIEDMSGVSVCLSVREMEFDTYLHAL